MSIQHRTHEKIRRSTVVNHDPLWRYMYADARTLPEAFQRGMRVSNDGPCLGYRRRRDDSGVDKATPYSWLPYSKVLDKSESLARGLLGIGAKPGQSTLIGVYSQNRPEVVITEQACYFFSMVVVSLYDTLGPEACAFILDKTELQIVVCDKAHRAENLLRQKIDNPGSALSIIVLMDEPSDDLRSKAYDCQVRLIKFDHLLDLGYSARDKMPPVFPMYPSPDDLATICYTSGTSGNPKGAMITHENIMAATTSSHMLRNCRVRPGDVMLSFLPMAHMYERLAQAIFYSSGGSIGFSRGDVKLLPDDIKSLQPHMLPSVPRLLNRMYDKIMEEVGRNVLKKWLLALAIQAKHAQLKNLTLRNDSLWDNVVFKKLQDQMGGRVKLLLSGSAPMSREVLHLLRAGLGAMVLEGYGATETSAAACLTMEGDTNAGNFLSIVFVSFYYYYL
uniref:long-chain-fatty-acid--CoA ligase n=1 Tax=Romanomermis culicivorax TaxID=13658 RepID=A0A915HRJ5_ROMCU